MEIKKQKTKNNHGFYYFGILDRKLNADNFGFVFHKLNGCFRNKPLFNSPNIIDHFSTAVWF